MGNCCPRGAAFSAPAPAPAAAPPPPAQAPPPPAPAAPPPPAPTSAPRAPAPAPTSAPRTPAPTPKEDSAKTFLRKFNDTTQIDNLFHLIDQRLKIASGERIEDVKSYVVDGEKFLQEIEKHMNRAADKKNLVVIVETKKAAQDLFKEFGKVHWLLAVLSVLGFVMEGYDQISENKIECLQLLNQMRDSVKHLKRLNDAMMEQKQKLEEIVHCIVAGSIMCVSLMKSSTLFRFVTPSVNPETLRDLQTKIGGLCSDFSFFGVIPDGVENRRKEVIDLLDLGGAERSSRVVVLLHGPGGIGKTTLADDVYAQIDLKSYRRCRIEMDENCNNRDLMKLQKQILQDLFGKNTAFRNCDEGRGVLISSLKDIQTGIKTSEPFFVYIDNALNKEDLKLLLPPKFASSLPPNSRVLVTTRDFNENDMLETLGIVPKAYDVVSLPDGRAKKLLCKTALGSENKDFDEKEIDVKALVRWCGGIPLALELVGSQIAKEKKVRDKILNFFKERNGGAQDKDLCSDIAELICIEIFKLDVREAFLDISSFFYSRWSSKTVAYIVGEEEFRALQEASFVKTSQEGKVVVPHVVRAKGRDLSKTTRIRDVESLRDALKDNAKLREVRGIFLERDFESEESKIELKENKLNLMTLNLRVLCVSKSVILSGKSTKEFQSLRYLDLDDLDIPCLPLEIEKLDKLAVFRGKFTDGISLYAFPQSLRIMVISGASNACKDIEFQKLPAPVATEGSPLLVKLCLNDLEKMETLPGGIHRLSQLQYLDLSGCSALKSLPTEIKQLVKLEHLDLSGCFGLKDLTALKHLNVSNCFDLHKLPANIAETIPGFQKLQIT